MRFHSAWAVLLGATLTASTACIELPADSSSSSRSPSSSSVDSTPPDGDKGKVLELVNQARAEARTCGSERFDAAEPLGWDDRLASSAQGHSDDMATEGYFSHEAPDGTQPADRVTAAGYEWSYVGENIAAGQKSPEEVMAAWLASPGHCANIMSPHYTQLGVGFALAGSANDPYGTYWTQNFGRPR